MVTKAATNEIPCEFYSERISEPRSRFSMELLDRQRKGLNRLSNKLAVGGRPVSLGALITDCIDEKFKAIGYTDCLPE